MTDCEECEGCGWSGPGLQKYRRHSDSDEHCLCEVCYCTPMSTAVHYPGHEPSNSDVLRGIGYATNLILQAVREKEKR